MNLYAACALTVAIETTFFALWGYRSGTFLTVCVCANTATNLLLNLTAQPLSAVVNITYFIYVLEAAAVAAEYAAYAQLEGRSVRLFGLTVAANALSYGAGLIIYGHI